MTKYYRIANINMSLVSDDEYFYDMCRDYEVKTCDVDMAVRLIVTPSIPIVGNIEIDRDQLKVTSDDRYTHAYYYTTDGVMYGSIAFDERYNDCALYLNPSANHGGLLMHDIGYLLFGTLFNYKLTYFDGISLHGSAISYKGEAIIFTAPSGVGKSTQAYLWKDEFGDEVDFINDDKPALRYENGSLMCYGTPFAGKNHINNNECIKVKAIINVIRAEQNSIEKMSTKDAVVLFLEETTRSMLNKKININNMQIISKIIACTPLYRLYCTPTKSAVDVTYNMLYEGL